MAKSTHPAHTARPPHLSKVQVWIYRLAPAGSLEVLLLFLTQERGGFWQPVTGGVDAGESYLDAALREANEETQLLFEASPFSLDYAFSFSARGHGYEEHVFGLNASELQDPILDPREHTDFKWVSPAEAFRNLKHASNAEGLTRLLKKLKVTSA
jgi:8-oxo-dGTP pyrophosphatase MutT (NUDIX family)